MAVQGIDAELLTRDQVMKLEPCLDFSRTARFPIEGAMIQRRGGTARHDAVAWGFARGADSCGVDIIQQCEVTGMVMDGNRVVGVETSKGRIGAGMVAICAAGHSGHVAGMAGLKLPVESQTLQAMVTEGVKPMVNTVVMTQSLHCYISQSDKGGIVFGGDPDNWPSYAQRGQPVTMELAVQQGLALIPALSRLRMLRCWAGVTASRILAKPGSSSPGFASRAIAPTGPRRETGLRRSGWRTRIDTTVTSTLIRSRATG